MGPIYETLGLTVGVIVHGKDPRARRAAYGCDVTYCTNKELTFDYLRDRIALGRNESRIQLAIERSPGGRPRPSQLRPARPVLRHRRRGRQRAGRRGAHAAHHLRRGRIRRRSGRCTRPRSRWRRADWRGQRLPRSRRGSGICGSPSQRHAQSLAEWAERSAAAVPRRAPARGAGRARRWSPRTCSSATRSTSSATRRCRSSTSTPAGSCADRSWEQGLHQMIEAKEGCPLSEPADVRRAHHLPALLPPLPAAGRHDRHGAARSRRSCGRSTGCRWCGSPPTGRCQRARSGRPRCSPPTAEKWQAIVARVRELHADRPAGAGRHALGGASEELSRTADRRRAGAPAPQRAPGQGGGRDRRPGRAARHASPWRPTWRAAAPTSSWGRASRSSAACT